MDKDLIKNKASELISNLKGVYEKTTFGPRLLKIFESKPFLDLMVVVLKNNKEFGLSTPFAEWFKPFMVYDKTNGAGKRTVQRVIVVETQADRAKLKELGLFTNLNTDLFIVINACHLAAREGNKTVSLYEPGWRMIAIEIIYQLGSHFRETEQNIPFYFVGTDLVYDFSTLLNDQTVRFLIQDVEKLSDVDRLGVLCATLEEKFLAHEEA